MLVAMPSSRHGWSLTFVGHLYKNIAGMSHCIVLYCVCNPLLNPESYDGARVLEASGRPMLVIGRSYWVGAIQEVGVERGTAKLADETTE